MKNEDGINAGVRRVGTTALFAIPLLLGAAAAVWLGAYLQAHNFQIQLGQERRRAIYVGAVEPPKAPIKLEVPRRGCIVIDRMDLEGETLGAYVRSTCNHVVEHTQVKWQSVAPDGTLLSSGSNFVSLLHGPEVVSPGDKFEIVFDGYNKIKLDERTVTLRVWASE